MQNLAQPPPLPILRALRQRRGEIQAALHENFEQAVILTANMRPRPASEEVATLCYFFLHLADLEVALNAALAPSQVKAEVKGLFGHHSNPFGPVVDRGKTGRTGGCELCDIMFVVSYGTPMPGGIFGNASFFQAKLVRKKIRSGKSGKNQCALYQKAKSFRFRKPERYTSSLPERTPAGWRDLPGATTSGFCFWSFEAKNTAFPWPWHSSTVTIPAFLDEPAQDRLYSEAVFQMMAGEFGLAVEPASPTEFGWNRIVHDFVLRASHEALGHTYGVIPPANTVRVSGDPIWINGLLRSGIALVKNPFREFFTWFGSKKLDHLAEGFALGQHRLPDDKFESLLRARPYPEGGEPEPPRSDRPPDDDNAGGGGSFVHINLTTLRQ